ncbi:hypothetical protein Tco_1561399 [Tanacetum coccineum]
MVVVTRWCGSREGDVVVVMGGVVLESGEDGDEVRCGNEDVVVRVDVKMAWWCGDEGGSVVKVMMAR